MTPLFIIFIYKTIKNRNILFMFRTPLHSHFSSLLSPVIPTYYVVPQAHRFIHGNRPYKHYGLPQGIVYVSVFAMGYTKYNLYLFSCSSFSIFSSFFLLFAKCACLVWAQCINETQVFYSI